MCVLVSFFQCLYLWSLLSLCVPRRRGDNQYSTEKEEGGREDASRDTYHEWRRRGRGGGGGGSCGALLFNHSFFASEESRARI